MSPNKASNTHTHVRTHTHTTKQALQTHNKIQSATCMTKQAQLHANVRSICSLIHLCWIVCRQHLHSLAGKQHHKLKEFFCCQSWQSMFGQSCFRCWPNETLLCTTKVQPMCRGGGWEGMNTVYPHCSCRCRNFKTVTGLKYTRMRRFFILFWSTAFALKLTTGTAFYFIWEDTAFLFQHVLPSPCLGGKPVYTSYLPHQTLWGKHRWYGRQLCWKHSWNVWR